MKVKRTDVAALVAERRKLHAQWLVNRQEQFKLNIASTGLQTSSRKPLAWRHCLIQ